MNPSRRLAQIVVHYDDGSATRLRAHARDEWEHSEEDRLMRAELVGPGLMLREGVLAVVADALKLGCDKHARAAMVALSCACDREIER